MECHWYVSLTSPISLCNKRDQNRIFAIIHLQRTKFAFSVYTLGQGESFEYDVSEKDPNKDSEIVKEKNNKNFFLYFIENDGKPTVCYLWLSSNTRFIPVPIISRHFFRVISPLGFRNTSSQPITAEKRVTW